MLDIKALEQDVSEQLQAHRVPGLALAVVHGGELVYANGFGVTSVEEGGAPVTPRTLFRIGSTTKPLTGTAIMLLVEQGVLDLDRPVSAYLPWLRFSRAGAEQVVTLRMLLSHTSGLDSQNNPYGSRDWEGVERWARADLPTVPFVAPPGRVYSYSNPGVALAGYVAATVYGKPFREMVCDLVFEPLGMTRSTFDPLVAMTYPVALPHDLLPDGTLTVSRPFAESAAQHPAGFAMSTVLDMAQFAISQMQGGRPVLSPESVGLMQTIQAPHYTVDGRGYGLTYFIGSYKGLKLVQHGGGIHNYQCTFSMLPEAGAAVIIMSNRISPLHGRLANRIFDQVLDLSADTPVTPAPTPAEPDRTLWPLLTGTFVSPLWGLAEVKHEGDRLTLTLQGRTSPLQAQSSHIYFERRENNAVRSVGFVPEDGGRPSQFLVLDSWTMSRFEPDPHCTIAPAVLDGYAGVYLSPATGREDVRLWVSEGRLMARFAWYPDREFPCTALNSLTRFASGGGVFELQEGALLINGWRLPRATA